MALPSRSTVASSVVSDGASASERISCDSGKFWTMAVGAAPVLADLPVHCLQQVASLCDLQVACALVMASRVVRSALQLHTQGGSEFALRCRCRPGPGSCPDAIVRWDASRRTLEKTGRPGHALIVLPPRLGPSAFFSAGAIAQSANGGANGGADAPATECSIIYKRTLPSVEGTELNYEEAKRLFLSAARKNYAPAQLMYAFMLQAGEGGDSQPFSAYVWGKIAELNGSEAAIDVTTLSNVQLEDEEIIEAEEVVANCRANDLTECPE